MNSRNQWAIVLLSGTIVLFLLLSLFYRYHINFFIRQFDAFLNYTISQNIFTVTLLFLIVQIPFYFCFLPGYSLFCLILAYILQNVTKTFLILSANALVLLILSYQFFKTIKNQWSYEENDPLMERIKLKFHRNKQLNTSLVQFMVFPPFFKTLTLVYLDVDFYTFLVHGLLW